MSERMKVIRRIVTGTDERGRSKIVWDGPAPNVHEPSATRNGYTDIWVWETTPLPMAGAGDAGSIGYVFPGPPHGGHVRVVQSRARPRDYDPARDPRASSKHPPVPMAGGRSWDRGGRNAFSSDMHKTETIDYAVLLEGERILVLDDSEVTLRPGDAVVQVGAWHQWKSPRVAGLMFFDMFAARFVEGSASAAQRSQPAVCHEGWQALPHGVRPRRRVVSIDRDAGKSSLASDGPSPDVRVDPARPGYASTRMWATDSSPAPIAVESLHLPYVLEPPAAGSVFRIDTYPPDETWKGKVGAREVEAFFAAMAAPNASTYSTDAPHPYMQKTRSIDFCVVLEGEITLVLDTSEVHLAAGDVVVQRGTNHAWSNRGTKPAVVAVASHGAAA